MKERFYNHVIRLDHPDIEGLLDGTITYSPKIDGSNASIRWDEENNCIAAFSRNRRLSAEKDNAGFYAWANSDDEEAKFLRNFCFMNPDLIIYGEWTGQNKFIGSIKDYDPYALGKMWIFDVYNTTTGEYYPDAEWRDALHIAWNGAFPWCVPYGVVTNPTMEKLLEIAKENTFLLTHANHPGEGIVIRRQGYKNKYGRYEIGKLVLDEFKQNQKKQKTPIEPGEIEKAIVESYVTPAELAKAKSKVCVLCDADEFNLKNGKMIGMYLNMVWDDAILDEIKAILKKFKKPTIDFAMLNRLCNDKAREYIGLY